MHFESGKKMILLKSVILVSKVLSLGTTVHVYGQLKTPVVFKYVQHPCYSCTPLGYQNCRMISEHVEYSPF